MPKPHVRYLCQNCGHTTPRWIGKCPECGEWNTLEEEVVPKDRPSSGATPSAVGGVSVPVPVTEVPATSMERMSTGIGEMDRVLGGGIVPGSVVLVGGDPGIGKSTLLTQVAVSIGQPVLYISGEESATQIRLRCQRLQAMTPNLYLANETDVWSAVAQIETSKVALAVVDSIQTTYDPAMESAPGTVTQVRHCASRLVTAAKSSGTPVFLIGHVTKEGSLAGPRILEHLVDTVLYFEGDRHHAYRILRAVKNRFGSTDEIGIFEMLERGLSEVDNPSAALLAERSEGASGSAVCATLEGSRPLLVEVQALSTRSFLASPRRGSTGMDSGRVNMLLAVLEKRLGLRLGEQDVFLNAVGGVRLVEPAADLAVAMAVASSYRDEPVDPHAIVIGEVGLGGEVRAVGQVEKRLREAARLGFRRAVIPRHNARRLSAASPIPVAPVADVREAMGALLAVTGAS